MNNPIKFRAWDFKSEQMFEVDEIRMRGNAYTVSIIGFSDTQWLTPERNAVMQFTGLKDRNRKEVYEGDIVDYYGELVEVKLMDFYIFMYERAGEGDIEVVGNIYEQSHLLDNKND
jgi:uncharacterized phage protein (TIGR01671 family)